MRASQRMRVHHVPLATVSAYCRAVRRSPVGALKVVQLGEAPHHRIQPVWGPRYVRGPTDHLAFQVPEHAVVVHAVLLVQRSHRLGPQLLAPGRPHRGQRHVLVHGPDQRRYPVGAVVPLHHDPVSVPVSIHGKPGSLRITSHPDDEIAEIWDAIVTQLEVGSVIALALFLVMMTVVGRALAPLQSLAQMMAELEDGRYGARVTAL